MKKNMSAEEFRVARRRARQATHWLRNQPRGCVVLDSYKCGDVRTAAWKAAFRSLKEVGVLRPRIAAYIVVQTLE